MERLASPGRTSLRYFPDGDVEPSVALDDREDGGDVRSGFLAAQMHPVLPAERDGAHRVLPFSALVGVLCGIFFAERNANLPSDFLLAFAFVFGRESVFYLFG